MVNFYSITYDANGSTAGITPVMQAAESSRESYYFALDEGRDLRKSGYSFIGWAEDKDAVDPKYIAGSTISLSQEAPNKTLFAVWRVDKAWDSITKMQELTPNTCREKVALETSTNNPAKQLTDERDGKTYWVTKLADGNCWMTQNLDYDIKTTDIANVIKFDNKTGLAEWPNKNDGIARYYDPGNYYKVDMSNWSSSGCNSIADGFANSGCVTSAGWKTTAASEEEKHFHVGNFYNWYAATKNTGATIAKGGKKASDSICPSGWVLPTGDSNDSGAFGLIHDDNTGDIGQSLSNIYKLTYSTAGAKAVRNKPLYFVPTGWVNGGVLGFGGATNNVWSSTMTGNGNPILFIFNSIGVNPNYNASGISLGASVRCLVLGS